MREASARSLLAAERRRSAARLAAATAELDDIVAASQGANTDDEHDPEGSTIAFERARVTMLLAEARAQLAAVERALARITAGDYGRCGACGAPIGEERLRARPTADRCMSCALLHPG